MNRLIAEIVLPVETGRKATILKILKVKDYDVVDFYLDNKKIFSADWENNLKPKFQDFLKVKK